MAGEGERSFAAVLGDIVRDLQQIVRSEIRLATVEAREEARKAKRGATLLIAGGAIAALALGLVLLAGVYAMATVVAPWLAAIIVAAVAAIAGGTLIAMGSKQMRQVAIAPRTIAAIGENLKWANTQSR